MLNKKQAIIYSAVVLVLIMMVIGFWYLYTKTKMDERNYSPKNTSMVEENFSAIEAAKEVKTETVRDIDATDHAQGDLSAPVKIVIYNDFECDFCAGFQDTIQKIKETFGSQVVISFRHFPLRSNPNAYLSALTAECAGEQGKFWEMHDRLFVDNKNNLMNTEQYEADAKELGLDMEKFSACLSEERGKEKIQADIDEAKKIGVAGSPQTFINGKPFPGAYPFEDFTDSAGITRQGMKTIIEKELNNNQ